MFGDIDNYVGQLKRHIDALALRAKGPIVLVGHSMAGWCAALIWRVTVRWWVRRAS